MLLSILPLVVVLGGQAAAQAPVAPAPAPRPAPPFYDVAADAQETIATQLATAATDGIRVLVVWGANDDGGSQEFAQAMRAPAVVQGAFFADEYRLVRVDVGHRDRNAAVAARYGVELTNVSLPAFTVLDDAGKVLAQSSLSGLGDGRPSPTLDAAKLASFLSTHEAPKPPDAHVPLAAALEKASASGKHVFLWFSAPWCVWCHKLGAWMAQPDVAPVLAKEFVAVRLDYDRAPGAKEVEKDYTGSDQEQGLPWFAFLDGAGKKVIDSTGPKGNVGFPAQPDELAHFKTMLETVKTHLTDAQIQALMASLAAVK